MLLKYGTLMLPAYVRKLQLCLTDVLATLQVGYLSSVDVPNKSALCGPVK